jgi:hypothetical protein
MILNFINWKYPAECGSERGAAPLHILPSPTIEYMVHYHYEVGEGRVR